MEKLQRCNQLYLFLVFLYSFDTIILKINLKISKINLKLHSSFGLFIGWFSLHHSNSVPLSFEEVKTKPNRKEKLTHCFRTHQKNGQGLVNSRLPKCQETLYIYIYIYIYICEHKINHELKLRGIIPISTTYIKEILSLNQFKR